MQYNDRQNETNEQYSESTNMKWHKFLIYFSLWLSAALSVFNAVQMFTGMQYGSAGDAQMIYMYFSGLKSIDIIMGIVSVGIAVYTIMVRFALARYQAKGPRMLTTLYVLNMAHSVIYSLLISFVCGIEIAELFGSSEISSIVSTFFMIYINKTYYGKRDYLFVN